ncbi:hypothetical protein [Campylobacter porcelli]|uniref:Uncharacterized protein n=1 Tax=Campylobacter porcelli TaxID=1660073 RepID=A0A1X9SYD5_9BACT|nr:hypothetical protein [Campylobacter sp. RM6137]ARR01223.1 hypothetical protein CSUIS_1434 [Campylobacter sp. RM6137]
MAISPISNAIYVNQNTPAAASVQSDFQSKLDMQMAMNAAASAEKKKEVEETRPTEETYKIDPENEHEKQTQKEDLNEQNHKRKRSDDEVDDDSEDVKFQKLDIVV